MNLKSNFLKKQSRSLLIYSSIFAMIVLFQNCGENSFQAKISGRAISTSVDLPGEISSNEQEVNDVVEIPKEDNDEENDLTGSTKIPATLTSSTGKIYYVSTAGNNNNAGTISKPFKTVAHAVSKMVAGDTTYVRGGLYNEISIHFSKSGTQSKPIKLLNYPGEKPIIDFGVNFVNRLVQRIVIKAPGKNVPIGWITIEGLEIRRGYEGVKMYVAHNISFLRNRIHDNISSAILGLGKNILIDRNAIYNNGPRDVCRVHGLYLSGPNYVITNNLVYNNGCYGIQVAGYPWDMLQYSEKPMDYKNGPDASWGGAANWVIANNTIAYNGSSGIVLWRSLTDNAKIFNNIFYENGTKARYSSSANGINFISTSGQTGHKIQNNVFYASGSGAMANLGANGKEGIHFTQSGNLTVNPNFVNAGATIPSLPSFALKANSPAIDRGLNLSSILSTKTSYNGVTRPKGKAYDIGAYEY